VKPEISWAGISLNWRVVISVFIDTVLGMTVPCLRVGAGLYCESHDDRRRISQLGRVGTQTGELTEDFV